MNSEANDGTAEKRGATCDATVLPQPEVTMGEVVRLFSRYWLMILSFLVVGIAGGAALAALRVPSVEERAVIGIGHYVDRMGGGATPRLLVSARSAMADIRSVFIPEALAHRNGANGAPIERPNIEVTAPGSGDIIVLLANCPVTHAAICRRLLDNVTTRAVREQNAMYKASRAAALAKLKYARVQLAWLSNNEVYEAKKARISETVNRAMRRLAAAKSRGELLGARLAAVGKTEAFVRNQVRRVRGSLRDAKRDRKLALKTDRTSGGAMLLIANDADIRDLQHRLAVLEERLRLSLPGQKRELEYQIEENVRTQKARSAAVGAARKALFLFETRWEKSQAHQRQNVAVLRAQADEFEPSKVLVAAGRVRRSVDASRGAIVLLGAGLGLLIGVLLGFALDFIRAYRQSGAAARGQ